MSFGNITSVHEDVATNTWTSGVYRDNFRILWTQIFYTSDATAGNRSIQFLVLDADNHTVWDSRSEANQAASLTRHYSIAPGFPRESSFSGNDDLYMPMPDGLIIQAGWKIKILDAADVSAADTFYMYIQLEEV